MIMWGKLDQNEKLVDVAGIASHDKKITLAASLEQFQKADTIDYPKMVKLWCKKVLEYVPGQRILNTLTVKDANHVFQSILKKENEATAYRCRAILMSAIKYSYMGEAPARRSDNSRLLPDASPAEGASAHRGVATEDVGKLKFSVAKFDQISHLVPLYAATGRFGWIKSEVQKQIHLLKEDEAGIIEAPKRSMGIKEGKAIVNAITGMFTKGNLPWTIRYNPNESVFIVMRRTHFERLTKKTKNGE